MTVILVSSFVVVLAPAFAGLLCMFNRIADVREAGNLTGARSFLGHDGSRL
jgi:hypothetical protein